MQVLQHGEVALPGKSKPSAPGTFSVTVKMSVVTAWTTVVIVEELVVMVSVVGPSKEI